MDKSLAETAAQSEGRNVRKERNDFLSKSKDQAQMAATTALSVVQVALLKEILDQGPERNTFFYPGLVMVSISLVLQIFVGAIALLVGHLRSYYASHNDDPCEDFFEDICCCGRRDQKEKLYPDTSLFGLGDDAKGLERFEENYQELVRENIENNDDVTDDTAANREEDEALPGPTDGDQSRPEDVARGSGKDDSSSDEEPHEVLLEDDLTIQTLYHHSGTKDLKSEEVNIKVELEQYKDTPAGDAIECGCCNPIVSACKNKVEVGFFERLHESFERCKFGVYKTDLALQFYQRMVQTASSIIRDTKGDRSRRQEYARALDMKKDAEQKRSRYFELKHRWERLQVVIEVDYKRLQQTKAIRTLKLISMWQQIINYCLYTTSVLNIFIAGLGIGNTAVNAVTINNGTTIIV